MSEEKTEAWTIRPCRAQDLDALRAICEETSSIELRNEKDRQFLLLTFCEAYVLYAADCFVAADENDRPVGYVFCASDTRRFFRVFRKQILPQIARLGFRYALLGYGICVQQTLCSVFAPAHLHIDLTESARPKGDGSALMKTLKTHLSGKGVARVGLTVNRKNVSAVRFYKKNGFKPVCRALGAYVMRAQTDGDMPGCSGTGEKEENPCR